MRAATRPALLIASLSLGLAACGTVVEAPDDGPAEIAATVAGTEITRAEVADSLEQQGNLLAEVPEEEREEAELQLERDILSARIQLAAVEAATDGRFGLPDLDARVEELLAQTIEDAGGESGFAARAEEQGLDVETATEFAREGAYVQALVEHINDGLLDEQGIGEAELQAEYDANVQSFQSSDARHILVETEAEAQAVLDRLDAGEDFGELAVELSTDTGSGANGGALGVAPRGSYVPEFSDAIYSPDTVLGEVIGPVESQFGFHLIIVDEIIEQPFDEVRPAIVQNLVGEELTAFFDSAFSDAVVEVDPYYGEWNAEQRMIVAPSSEDEGEADAGSDEQD